MSEDAAGRHQEIQEQLPDYAVGALPDAEMRLIAAHLATCESCQREVADALDAIARYAPVALPGAVVRERIHAQIERESADVTAAFPQWPVAPTPATTQAPARSAPDRRLGAPSFAGRKTALFAFGALSLLVLALIGWNLILQGRIDDRSAAVTLVEDADQVHPLSDSALSPPASGAVFTIGDRTTALLVAHDLPPLAGDQRYQVWLFTADGERISGGLFSSDADGHARVVVQAPASLNSYVALGVSAEPRDGSLAPTAPLALGGWLGFNGLPSP